MVYIPIPPIHIACTKTPWMIVDYGSYQLEETKADSVIQRMRQKKKKPLMRTGYPEISFYETDRCLLFERGIYF